MDKILAFAGSNSSNSINYKWLSYLKENYLPSMEIIDIRKFNIPLFGVDLENQIGSPLDIKELYDAIQYCNLLLISSPEHNGNMTAFQKSTLDWLSRLDRNFIKGKHVALTSTSPGRAGASSSLANTKKFVERLDGVVVGEFSLPSFNHVFEEGQLIEEHHITVMKFINEITV